MFERQLDINMDFTPRHGVECRAHISCSHFMFADRWFFLLLGKAPIEHTFNGDNAVQLKVFVLLFLALGEA